MNRAESYLYDRLDLLSDEKVILITKINKIDLEVEETILKIDELKQKIDDAFEVFSPRSKKNDFVKNEIVTFQNRLEDLNLLKREYDEQIKLIDDDVDIIRESLGQEPEEDYYYNVEENEDSEINSLGILKGQEIERQRIAMELHDSTVQVLTNLVHKCEICSKFMEVDITRSKLELEVMSKTLKEIINEIRNIIYDLRPMSFDDIGLDVTIERIVSIALKTTDMDIVFKVKGKKTLIGEVESLTLIRILQESINNSIKYSEGKRINIELEYLEDKINLKIMDDGKGFEVNKLKKNDENKLTGFGLSIMKERVYLLKGNIDIKSEIDKGTEIKVTIPILNEIGE